VWLKQCFTIKLMKTFFFEGNFLGTPLKRFQHTVFGHYKTYGFFHNYLSTYSVPDMALVSQRGLVSLPQISTGLSMEENGSQVYRAGTAYQ
jgi:hypothetical protein